MPYAQQVIALLALASIGTIFPGCPRRGGVVVAGSEAVSGSDSSICYTYQLSRPGGPSPRTPLIAVLWRAKEGTGSIGGSNDLLHIHGRRVSADLDRKAVYALQLDHSLKELSLTPAEVDQLLSNLEEARLAMMRNAPVTRLQDNAVFMTKVASQLADVEAPDRR